MATSVKAQATDPVTQAAGSIVSSGGQMIVQDAKLFGDVFDGSTVDSAARWTSATASGGTIVQGAGIVTLAPSTNTAGQASLTSIPVFPMISGAEIKVRVSAKLGTVPVASNTRQVLLKVDANNYAGFVIDGATMYARAYGASTELKNEIISTVVPSTLNWMDLELRMTKTTIQWLAKGSEGWVQVASFDQCNQANTMMGGGGLSTLFIETLNSGSAVSNTLILGEVLVTRRGLVLPGQVKVKAMTAAGVVCYGPCFFVGAYLTASGGGWEFYNNLVGSGATDLVGAIGSGTLGNISLPPLPIECCDGLYAYESAGTSTCYVYYIEG